MNGLQTKSPGADKVLNFLQRIQGLHSLPPDELQKVLYSRRFELLGLNTSDTAGKAEAKNSLPEYSSIPNQHELHEALLGGGIPGGYQCVAHVLYPESVPWPIQKESVGELETAAEAPTVSDVTPTSPISLGTAPASDSAGTVPASGSLGTVPASGSLGTVAASGDWRLTGTVDRDREVGGDGEGVPDESPGLDPELDQLPEGEVSKGRENADAVESRRGSKESARDKRGSLPGTKEKTASFAFTLCGQKLGKTVRGKPVAEMNEDVLAWIAKQVDDNRYTEAKDARKKLEKQVQLEQYAEKKLIDRIHTLEFLKKAEIESQQEIRKRDARRQSRKEELQEELKAAWVVKLRRETEQQELENEQKQAEIEKEKKWQSYHEKQKRVVDDWYQQKMLDPQSEEGLASHQAERMAKEKQLAKERERKLKPKTVKAQLADEKVQRLNSATEQRPPLPPRPHDLSRPVADLLDASIGSSGRSTPPRSAKQGPTSWTKDAKKVSDAYGLTPREHTSVENRFARCIQGSGRMAKYEDR